MSIWILFKIIGSLALLIYGMKVMSEALQKMAGSQLRHILGAMTTNRFTGLMTGMFVTASVQSSTATTVMTVSFVNAGLLTLAQAISVIMGANIGTTFTAWIMTLGFSFNMADVVFPAFFIALLLIYSKKRRYIGDFLFGIAFMFFAISTLGTTGKEMDLSHNQMVIDFFSSFDKDSYLTVFAFLGIGTVLTFCMQSSAALMAITMVLCSSGVLPIYMGIALVLGENIGTTITSNIAAMGANTQARRAAFAHLTFNVFGVLNGEEVSSVAVDLANYTESSTTLLDTWTMVDLKPLGEVSSIYFTFESTDSGQWGINTPTYVAIDRLKVRYQF